MKNFTYQVPTKFVFGRGAENEVGREIRALGGKKVLIHYGGGSAVRSGLIGRVQAALEAEGIAHVELGGVQPNPRDTLVYQGIELARREGVDFVLAVGGGSAIDSSKAIAHGICYDGDFWDFFCRKAQPERTTPFGVVLTMAAAGSESSNSCVITQASTLTKRGLSSELNRPKFAIMNPELAMTLPPYQIACGATDILAHIMERYFTCEKEVDLTDRLCEGAMQAVIRAARIAVRNPKDYDAQAQLMWGSTIAHNDTVGVGRVSDFGSHQIEHELSALYDVAHGAGLAVVFPAWMRYQMHKDVMRFAQFAVRVYRCDMDFEHPERTALAGIEAHEAFLKDIGMPITLKELGARTEDIPALAAKTKKTNLADQTTGGAFPMKTEDIEAILRIADR
ncbi:MAG TPA: iron-containing alcohol dehydrogenase [Candidatus Faecivicinus avistercoris]|nr:iron-containing alcohol dehydrogenase [Candidatus Faecivicinus avistercoris]